jgi:hypothetical protein
MHGCVINIDEAAVANRMIMMDWLATQSNCFFAHIN